MIAHIQDSYRSTCILLLDMVDKEVACITYILLGMVHVGCLRLREPLSQVGYRSQRWGFTDRVSWYVGTTLKPYTLSIP